MCFGGLKEGLKGLQKDAKKLVLALFDPPGSIKLFSRSFSAWSHWVCVHSNFFLQLSISQNIFKFYAKVAKSLGRNQIWWKTESTNFGHFRTWRVHCFEDVFIAMEVSSNLVDVFEATSDPLVQLYVCEGSSPKRLGAKVDNNCFFHFFLYFRVNYHKRIFLHTFCILFGNILHIFGHKIKKLVIMLFFYKLSKRTSFFFYHKNM